MSVAQHIIVARATIQDKVQVVPEDPVSVEVQVGQPFTIGMSYRLYETSSKKDRWQFRLTTSMAGLVKSTDATIEDRAFARDDRWANVRTEHVIETAGEHAIEFHATALLERGDWGSGSPLKTVDQAEHRGTLRINAR